MGRIVGTLKVNKFDKDMHLLESRKQPMRSWTKGFMELLYIPHSLTISTAPYTSLGDIDLTPRNLCTWPAGFNNGMADHGSVNAPAGRQPHLTHYGASVLDYPLGCDLGIQIGTGSTAVTPADMRLVHRIGHGDGAADVVDQQYDVSQPPDNQAFGLSTANTQMAAAPFVPLRDYRCDSVQLKLYKFGTPSGNLVVEIRSSQVSFWNNGGGQGSDTLPSSTVLATGTIATSGIPAGAGSAAWLTCTFGSPVDLYAGHIYFINIWAAGVDGSDVIYWRYASTGTMLYDRPLSMTYSYQGAYWMQTSGSWTSAYYNNSISGNTAMCFIVQGQSQGEMEYGGCEIVNRVTANPNDSFDIRRFFTNKSGNSLVLSEIGINSFCWCNTFFASYGYFNCKPMQIARDVLVSPITVANTQLLQVTYTVQVTT